MVNGRVTTDMMELMENGLIKQEHMSLKMEQYDEDAIKWLDMSKVYNMFSPLFFG